MIKTVHVVFKTHLDIGFTDLASKTIERYFEQFIPNAITTAQRLRERGGEQRLVWTTGSWLVKSYLSKAVGPKAEAFVKAIQMGDITWHALPFTTHTELMDSNLIQYGLSIAKQLDQRFGHKSIAAKMTDVPGHTLAMVPHLAKAGVQFLHLGVNGGSPLPNVPPLFVWRAPTGEEVIVQYDASYGSREPIGSLQDLLVIENSADNSGPPSEEEVVALWSELRAHYPQARIIASSLDAYAEAILPYKGELEVVTQEIGDTWIHGVGSDPYKVSMLRTLLALAKRWREQGRLQDDDRFFENLLMVCEHTWGMDFKKYLGDYKNWSVEDFSRARQKDRITEEDVPPSYQFIEAFAKREYAHIFSSSDTRRESRTYSYFSSSHQEQRDYISSAIEALPESLSQEAKVELKQLDAEPFVMHEDDHKLSVGTYYAIGRHKVCFNNDGSIAHLLDENGHDLAKEDGIGVYRYEAFGFEDYEQFHRKYNRNFDLGKDWIWADFGKPGMEQVEPKVTHRLCKANENGIYLRREEDGWTVGVILCAEEDSPRGAPMNLALRYSFDQSGRLYCICLDWMDKEATRLPEALWLGVSLQMKHPGTWRMKKLGYDLELDNTVMNGSRSIHAVEQISFDGEDAIGIKNIDSPLVSLDARKLLRFDNQLPQGNGTFHFNLQNNIWNTNFPLWYDQNGRSRLLFTYS